MCDCHSNLGRYLVGNQEYEGMAAHACLAARAVEAVAIGGLERG